MGTIILCGTILLLNFYIEQLAEVKVVYFRKENYQIVLQISTLRP